jgi:ParB/RepB/Spo0J family partition protein
MKNIKNYSTPYIKQKKHKQINKRNMKKPRIMPEARKDIHHIDVNAIEVIDGFNIREDYGNVDELAKSIKENGVLVPMKGRRNPEKEGYFLLTAGHRRLMACKLLLKSGEVDSLRVPFLIESRGVSETDRLVDMLAGNDGKKLTVLEQAELVKRLLNQGLTEKEIQIRLVKSPTFISNCLTLLEAPEKIKKMIKQGNISSTLVIELFRKEKDFDLIIEQLSKINYAVEGTGTSSSEKKITRKQISDRYNSIGFFRKFAKVAEKEQYEVKPAMREVYDMVVQIIEGKIGKDELQGLFFEPKASTEAEGLFTEASEPASTAAEA